MFWSQNLDDAVIDAGVIHHPDNKSDHSPVYCVLDCINILHDVKNSEEETKPRPSWKKATTREKEAFRSSLEENLSELETPMSLFSCRDVQCKDPDHIRDLENFSMELLETVQAVAEDSLPVPVSRSDKEERVVPGWREYVEPFKQQAYFWHQVWQSCGRPTNCQVHMIMKRTRNRYH